MAVVKDHTERILDQEIDTLQICPSNPNHMVIGTYSLTTTLSHTSATTRDEHNDSESLPQSRIGSVRALLIDYRNQDSSSDTKLPQQPRLDLPCAVLDLRFCPTDDTLVAVATSIGELRFYRLVSFSDSAASETQELEIVPVGVARLSGQHGNDESEPPLVTQFAWLQKSIVDSPNPSVDYDSVHCLATCDTSGHTRLIEVTIPNITSKGDLQPNTPKDQYLKCRTRIVHKHLHNLEAWTIAAIDLPSDSGALKQLLLSGGDDSCLIASTYTLRLNSPVANSDTDVEDLQFDTDPTRIHLDKQTHSAGVVAIHPLPPPTTTTTSPNTSSTSISIPILTGSYDQSLRLILFNPATQRFTPISSLELEGGVWRIALIDTYTVPNTGADSTPIKGNSNSSVKLHYVLLISAMYAGWYIVRLTYDMDTTVGVDEGWTWQIDVRVSRPHESMVYACAAVCVDACGDGVRSGGDGDGNGSGKWKVITTSFYDKRICVWDVEDTVRAELGC